MTPADVAPLDRVRRVVVRLRSPSGQGGPAAESLRRSITTMVLTGLAAWHLLLAVVFLVGDPRLPTVAMVGLHVTLAGVAVAAVRGPVPFLSCVLLGYGAWALDYLAARSVDDAITLAACWLGDLLYAAPAFVMRSRARTWIPLVLATVVSVVLVQVGSIWSTEEVSAFVVTAVALVLAVRLAMPGLWALADDADAARRRLEEELQEETVLQQASAVAAEDTRLVHDTVINTLGAVANGGSGDRWRSAVRDRCLQDADIVDEILRGRRRARRHLAEISGTGHVQVWRTGAQGVDLDEIQELVGPEVTEAVLGAVDEALRNVAKHAGVGEAEVAVARTASSLVVTVADRGRGLGGAPPSHGIEESIRGRIAAVGGRVVVLSSEPGSGTTVRITCPLVGQAGEADRRQDRVRNVDAVAEALLRRAAWLLSVGILGVGVFIEATNRPGELTWTYAMLGLVGLCVGVAALAWRRTSHLPMPVGALFVAAVPSGFAASMAGIDFGRDQTLTYQAIGILPLFVIPLALRARRAVAAGVAALLVAVVAVGVAVASDGPGLVAVVVVGAAPAAGIALGWVRLDALVHGILEETVEVEARAFQHATEAGVRREVAVARQRWGDAGLQRSASLLRGLAVGDLDVFDASVRQACAAEELYLRELLLLSPSAFRMSVWFARALAAARAREVRLVVRSGDDDPRGRTDADVLGALVLELVGEVPPGSTVTIGWFTTGAGRRLSVVRPRQLGTPDDRNVLAARDGLPSTWSVSSAEFADQQMIEVVL